MRFRNGGVAWELTDINNRIYILLRRNTDKGMVDKWVERDSYKLLKSMDNALDYAAAEAIRKLRIERGKSWVRKETEKGIDWCKTISTMLSRD